GPHVHEAVVVQVPDGIAVQVRRIGEQATDGSERAITVALEVGGATARQQDVQVAVVVEILKMTLDEHSDNVRVRTGNLGEVSVPIVLEELQLMVVVPYHQVQIAIIVPVTKVGTPALIADLYTMLQGQIRVIAVAIIHEHTVPAPGIGR